MPPPIRVCSTLDCDRTHYAKGFCRRCYTRHTKKRPVVNFLPLTAPLKANREGAR